VQGETGPTGPQGPQGDAYEITSADYAEIAGMVETSIQPTISAATAAANNANTATNAANSAATAANSAASRAEDAIDAMGDISEMAVPLMSADVRGGAKLGDGLTLTDGALGIDPAPHESTGEVRGSIAALTAKGHAEQDGTPTPSAPVEIQVVRGRNLALIDATHIEKPSWYTSSWYGTTQQGNGIRVTKTNGTGGAGGIFVENVKAGQYALSCKVDNSASAPSFRYYISGKKTDGTVYDPGASIGMTSSGNKCYASFNVPADLLEMSLRLFPTSFNTDYTYADFLDIQLERGSVATPYVPYGHVGLEAQGRNLLDGVTIITDTYLNPSGYQISDADWMCTDYIPIEGGATYTFEPNSTAGGAAKGIWYSGTSLESKISSFESGPYTGEAPANAKYVRLSLKKDSPSPRLEMGDTLYHTTTPIPLPQRGWVASLPDGTADVLTLDGAGKCEWTLPTSKITGEELASNVYTWIKSSSFSGGYYISGWAISNRIPMSTNHLQTHLITANNQAEYLVGTCLFDNSLNLRMDNDTYPTIELFKQWLASSGFELLYPLATPVTEERGYVEDWPTDIPEGAVITIPELDALGVKYYVGGAAVTLAHQWYERARSEYEDRIASLEDAVAQLIAEG